LLQISAAQSHYRQSSERTTAFNSRASYRSRTHIRRDSKFLKDMGVYGKTMQFTHGFIMTLKVHERVFLDCAYAAAVVAAVVQDFGVPPSNTAILVLGCLPEAVCDVPCP
jgi:hypothetical protein